MGYSSFRKKILAAEWAVHGMQFLQDASSCSDVRLSQPTMGCRGIFALVPGVRPPILLLWPWCSQGYFSHFPPHSPLPEPFLNSLSEVPPPWLQGLAMPCSGCVGICWNWHRMALAALWRGCLAVPTASAWAQTPPTITENIWYAEPGAFV